MDIVESMLQALYAFPDAAEKLKKSTPLGRPGSPRLLNRDRRGLRIDPLRVASLPRQSLAAPQWGKQAAIESY
jgi:hypothetical protein